MMSYNKEYSTEPIYGLDYNYSDNSDSDNNLSQLAYNKVLRQSLRLRPHTGASAASGEGHIVPERRTMPPALCWCASLASKRLICLGGTPYQKKHVLVYQNHLPYRWVGRSGGGVFVAWRSSPWCGLCWSDCCKVSEPPIREASIEKKQ